MATFDGWEAQLYGPNTLAHFRTKGAKNGVRRFQNEDGTWTPLGLKERKEREGWGSERKARRAEKKAARAERKAANAAARKERIAAFKEEQRKKNPKNMTEEELRKNIEHIKLEQEYRELTRSPLLKLGASAVKGYLKYKENKAAAERDRKEQEWKDRQLAINEKNAKAAILKAQAEESCDGQHHRQSHRWCKAEERQSSCSESQDREEQEYCSRGNQRFPRKHYPESRCPYGKRNEQYDIDIQRESQSQDIVRKDPR